MTTAYKNINCQACVLEQLKTLKVKIKQKNVQDCLGMFLHQMFPSSAGRRAVLPPSVRSLQGPWEKESSTVRFRTSLLVLCPWRRGERKGKREASTQNGRGKVALDLLILNILTHVSQHVQAYFLAPLS